ncbi:hypothetical protein JTE90_011505 [Oedothorax gibbosus]|uniref:phosphatidylinositol 3-kinase n=1 Tax=Oedothorax gibbosus TaxID=931172 RepID=A0AAV6VC80_9ARAC|nr:hypothetical protein JTE90_011505 [Oedothorax gibbosus]
MGPMDSALNPYVSLDFPDCVPDVWDQDPTKDTVSVDILLPTGCFMPMRVRRDITLAELKEEVWDASRQLPLSRLLHDPSLYAFECVNLGTAERELHTAEESRLSEVRPFQAVLRLVEKTSGEAGWSTAKLATVIGIGLKEFDHQRDPEVHDFRRRLRSFCERQRSSSLEGATFESRVLLQHPVSLAPRPELPPYLKPKLSQDGEMVLTISAGQHATETTFKMSVSPSLSARGLLDTVLRKKGPSIGLQHAGDFLHDHLLLKMCGLEEYLIGPHPLSQYKYIQDCLSCDKIPELILVASDTIHLEAVWDKVPDGIEEKPTPDTPSLKRKKQTISSWNFEEPLRLTIHSVYKLNYEPKTKVCVQVALYHGDESLCEGVLHTQEATLCEGGSCSWEKQLQFALHLADVPRAAKLCICVYEASATQKTSRFRKCQGKYACPVAWVNCTVFDYRGALRSCPLSLPTWPFSQAGDEYSSVMVRPLGCLTPNPYVDMAGEVTISFGKYHPTLEVVYPDMEEILESSDRLTTERNANSLSGGASKLYTQQLQQICDRDALYQLHEQEKELLWRLRLHCAQHLPVSLPKLLRCLRWNDRREVAEMMRLLRQWPLLSPTKALELLDYAYPDPAVRAFAVRCLRSVSGGDDLSLYLLQLVQAMKHECCLRSDLCHFLLEKALQDRILGHRLFWLLRSDIQFPEARIRFGVVLESYCRAVPPSHLLALEKQVLALNQLKMANHFVQVKGNIKKEEKERLRFHIQELLGKQLQSTFHGLQNPLDPRFRFGKIRVEKCKFLDSKMKPLWLAFENTDKNGKDVFIIFKNGDDLRQDMLTLQMIRIMDRLWKDEGLDLRMIPYQCMATGHRVGLIEVVPNADTIANIQKEKGFTATSAFKKGSIYSWLRDHNPDDASLSRAAEEFTLSCAGYCVATYVLGVADRHSDNIMVKTNGQLFHVDFGHILGKFKEKFGFRRERVPFVLTNDFVHIITKGQNSKKEKSPEFNRFQQHCERAFTILRRHGPLVISLFALMLSTGLPELSSERDLDYLRDTLVLDRTEQEAVLHFRAKFVEAINNSWKTSANWAAHNWAKDNKIPRLSAGHPSAGQDRTGVRAPLPHQVRRGHQQLVEDVGQLGQGQQDTWTTCGTTLVLDRTEQEAVLRFRAKFVETTKNSWKTSANWAAHNWATGNKMSD